jgi:hypothetical protein
MSDHCECGSPLPEKREAVAEGICNRCYNAILDFFGDGQNQRERADTIAGEYEADKARRGES